MTDQATFGIAITASDKTAKGKKSAEKNLGQIPKNLGALNRRAAEQGDRAVARSGKGILRTLGSVEQAAARAFGSRSLTSGFTSRLGAIREAASAAGSGIGEASAAGDVLSGTLGALGRVAGGTIGVMAATAYGAFKLADGWAKGAAAIGHTAEILGIATKAYQTFIAAGERAGLDKGTAGAAIGGLNQSLNDARFGRNNDVLALLGRLGVKLQTKEDGTVDTEAMLPRIADAIAKQNSSGRRTAAGLLGISEAALPAFTQGGSALKADMEDAAKNAVVIDDDKIEMAKRVARKSAMIGQSRDRMASRTGEVAAVTADRTGVYEGFIGASQFFSRGVDTLADAINGSFKPSAQTSLRAAEKMERAAGQIERVVGRSGLRGGTLDLSSKDITDLKKTVATEWDHRSVAQGQGIIDTILNRQASGRWGSTVASVVNSKSQFSDVNGPVAWRRGRHSVDEIPQSRIDRKVDTLVDEYLARRSHGARSVVGDNLNYANPHHSDRRNLGWINRLDGPVLGAGQSVHRHGTTPELERYRPGAFGVALPGQQPIPVHVTVEHRNAPPGTRTTVRAGSGGAPAVSQAFEPVRGG